MDEFRIDDALYELIDIQDSITHLLEASLHGKEFEDLKRSRQDIIASIVAAYKEQAQRISKLEAALTPFCDHDAEGTKIDDYVEVYVHPWELKNARAVHGAPLFLGKADWE